MRKVITIVLVTCFFNSIAQTGPETIIKEFFRLYEKKDSGAALDYLFGTNRWMNESKGPIENVKFKINSTVVNSMGDYYGYELVTKKTIGDKLIFYSYLLMYDRQPIRFNFLFYNPNGNWRLQNFSFDDKIKDELEEGAKAYRLKENLEY